MLLTVFHGCIISLWYVCVLFQSTGELKESGDRVGRLLVTMLQDVNGIFVHSTPPNGTEEREELANFTGNTHSTNM